MSNFGNDAKISSFPVGESGTNVTTITFGHRSGKILATGSDDSTIHVHSIGQTNSLFSSQCQTTALTALRFSKEENLLASGSRSGAINICDLESQKITHLGDHKTCIRSIEYFPSSNNFLATGAVDGTAKLWDPRRKGFIFNYQGHNGAINALRFSPDGRFLITASDDTAIRMWDVSSGKVIKAFQEHQGPVFTITYHPIELMFASAGADRRIKFWDLEKFQFISETDMETSAIRCLAFEPTNGNYILSGSNDILCVHSWEPIQLLDSVQMNWKNILDMTIHKDLLYGTSAVQNKVYIASMNLSNLNTKRRNLPPNDYRSNVSSVSVSNAPKKHVQLPPTIVKDEPVKIQPKPSNGVKVDESKLSVVDKPINYDEVFGAKGRVGRSPNRPEHLEAAESPVEVFQPPPASSRPKTSQSVSPSNKGQLSEQPPQNEQIFANLSKGNQTISSVQQKRIRNLTLLMNLSRGNSRQTAFQAIVASHDLSLECFLLHFVNEKLPSHDSNLELCTIILSAVRDLIKSHYQQYNEIACQTLEKIMKDFGRVIYDNVGAKSIGVDLNQQARRDKCQSCHHALHEIRTSIEDRLKSPIDPSLKQTFDNIIRLLNKYERS